MTQLEELKSQLELLDKEYKDKRIEISVALDKAIIEEKKRVTELQEYLNTEYLKYDWLIRADGKVTHYAQITEEDVKCVLSIKHPSVLDGLKLNKKTENTFISELPSYVGHYNNLLYLEFDSLKNFHEFVVKYEIQLDEYFLSVIGNINGNG